MNRDTANAAMIMTDIAGTGDIHPGHRLWPAVERPPAAPPAEHRSTCTWLQSSVLASGWPRRVAYYTAFCLCWAQYQRSGQG